MSLFNRVASETLAATDSLTQAQKHSERLLRLVQAVACVLSRVCRDAQADTEAGTAPASTTEEQDAYYDLQLYFWLHAVAFRLVGEHESPWPLAVQDAISTIAEASPVLVSPRAKQYFGCVMPDEKGMTEKLN